MVPNLAHPSPVVEQELVKIAAAAEPCRRMRVQGQVARSPHNMKPVALHANCCQLCSDQVAPFQAPESVGLEVDQRFARPGERFVGRQGTALGANHRLQGPVGQVGHEVVAFFTVTQDHDPIPYSGARRWSVE